MSPGIANDLLMLCDDIGMGRVQRPDLLGEYLTLSNLTILSCHAVHYVFVMLY